MYYKDNKVYDLKIAYIGGGSRGWAWNLMSDLAVEEALHGKVYLYDIDFQAAKNNEMIGNSIRNVHKNAENFDYIAVRTIDEALINADFVIISILPGTFDEMEVDVHEPEKYGIYQSVGDTVGLGGTMRALRTLPMFEEFALAIKKNCPDAWVINYTNPMTMCTRMMYKVFPEIKAFGCCHEVFGTQDFMCRILEKMRGITDAKRKDIKVSVVGVNHFTWLKKATYKNIDLFPIYREFCEKYKDTGMSADLSHMDNWFNKYFKTCEKVKMDLFMRYGIIAAAGDRHLAEFCPQSWYLKDEETVEKWGFGLTPVSWRKNNRKTLLEKSERLANGAEEFKIEHTGEEGVIQMKALLGLGDIVTNINFPNMGQISNLPIGAVVETNARFTSNSVEPVFSGEIPNDILGLISNVVSNQENIVEAAFEKKMSHAFKAFINDAQNTLSFEESRELFDTMTKKTANYLKMYDTTL